MRLRIVVLVLAVLSVFLLPSAAQADPAVNNGNGLSVVSTDAIDSRQTEYTVATTALKHPVRIRVVLPTGYNAAAAKRYPVLYLYHGTSGTPADWVTGGDLLRTTAGTDIITVLPESGYNGDGGGWFVNWWNNGKPGVPNWEDFEIDQVIPWIDANFKTRADRDHRAIAGLSQGGFGSFHGAARHPDLFTSVAAFSGAPEIYRNPLIRSGAEFVVEGTTWVITPGNIPFAAFGDALTNGIHWAGHDPGTMVENLRGMDINLWTASGLPGEFDSAGNKFGGGTSNAIELLTHMSTLSFAGHLTQANIPHYYQDYVLGTHSFAYWARDLREYLPKLMARFANPSTPAKKSYMSIEPSWSQWGWNVVTDRPAGNERFTFLSGADADGFTFKGRNKATVTTPANYQPGRSYTVKVAGSQLPGARTIAADVVGRLAIPLDLGRAVLPADLSFLGLPGGLGKYPDAVATVTIAPIASVPSAGEPEPRKLSLGSLIDVSDLVGTVLQPATGVLRLLLK